MKKLLITAKLLSALSFAPAVFADQIKEYKVPFPERKPTATNLLVSERYIHDGFKNIENGIGDEVCPIPNLLNQFNGIEKVNSMNCDGGDDRPPPAKKKYITCDLTSDFTVFKGQKITRYFISTQAEYERQLKNMYSTVYIKKQRFIFDGITIKEHDVIKSGKAIWYINEFQP